MARYEDFCFDTFCEELFGYPFDGELTCFVVIVAKVHGTYIRISFKHLPQHMVGYTAGGGIAVVTPAVLVQRYKREHIYRRLKEIDSLAPSDPVKAESRIAAVRISLEGTLRACSSLVSVDRYTVRIFAEEYGVVIVCLFIDESGTYKGVQHLSVDPSLIQEVAIDTAHIIVPRRQFKGF